MKLNKFIFFLMILFSHHELMAQPNEAATYFAKYITAMKYYEGDGLPSNKEKAFVLMKECAEEGQMDEAMLKLGLMYKLGVGTQKSEEDAFKWINNSSKKGNNTAHYALGRLYKEGAGTMQDFGEARKAFQKSADAGNTLGKYMLGYMYHRGLGGQQDYKKAVELFSQADSEGNPESAYMLGISYKNGYGVPKDIHKGDSFLNKAIEKGVINARMEIQNAKNEVNEQRDRQYEEHVTSKGLKEKSILQENLKGSISGEWQGKQYTFDWSKKHILEEVNLTIQIIEKDGLFHGQWYEDGKLLLNFSGKIVDKIILFDKTEFAVSNKFGEQGKMVFIKAKLELLTSNKKYLAGEVESYVTSLKEPGYPIYVVAEKENQKTFEEADSLTTNKTNKIEEQKDESTHQVNKTAQNQQNIMKNQDEIISFLKDKEETFRVYPNPVVESITLEYDLEVNTAVSLSIYNSNGSLILKKELDESHIGHNSHRLDFNAIAGTYILFIHMNGQSYSKVIIKK